MFWADSAVKVEDSIDLNGLIRLFVNHRPVVPVSKQVNHEIFCFDCSFASSVLDFRCWSAALKKGRAKATGRKMDEDRRWTLPRLVGIERSYCITNISTHSHYTYWWGMIKLLQGVQSLRLLLKRREHANIELSKRTIVEHLRLPEFDATRSR